MPLFRRGVFTIGPNWQPMSDPHEAERLARAQLQAQISAGLRAEEAADQRAALDAVISGQDRIAARDEALRKEEVKAKAWQKNFDEVVKPGQDLARQKYEAGRTDEATRIEELRVDRNEALFSDREEKRLALEKEERARFNEATEWMQQYALDHQQNLADQELEGIKAGIAKEKTFEEREYKAGLLKEDRKYKEGIAAGKAEADEKRKEHADMTQELAKSDLIKELAKRPEQYWPTEEEGGIRGDSPEWSTIQNSMSLLSSDLIHRYKHDDTKRGLIEDLKRNIGLFLMSRLGVYQKLKDKASQDYIKSHESFSLARLMGTQAEGLKQAGRNIPQRQTLEEELSNIRHIIGSFPGLHNDPYLNGLIQNIQKVINA